MAGLPSTSYAFAKTNAFEAGESTRGTTANVGFGPAANVRFRPKAGSPAHVAR